jgi:hypothetical protein
VPKEAPTRALSSARNETFETPPPSNAIYPYYLVKYCAAHIATGKRKLPLTLCKDDTASKSSILYLNSECTWTPSSL